MSTETSSRWTPPISNADEIGDVESRQAKLGVRCSTAQAAVIDLQSEGPQP